MGGQIRLVKEALERGLEYLSRAMVIHEHVPRLPAMSEFLVKAIGKHPNMQSEIAFTMYQLGFLVKS